MLLLVILQNKKMLGTGIKIISLAVFLKQENVNIDVMRIHGNNDKIKLILKNSRGQ